MMICFGTLVPTVMLRQRLDGMFDRRFGIAHTVFVRIIVSSMLLAVTIFSAAFIETKAAVVVAGIVIGFLSASVLGTALMAAPKL